MRPTIRDVARQAGVSIATVSRVVRGSDAVTPAMRDRVLAAIEELQYTPSRLGQQLAERRHAANGIVFPDLSGPYFAEVVLGYESVAAELGRSVLILSTDGRDAAPAMVEDMAGRCDGLVILGATVPDEVIRGLARRLPVVLLARPPLDGLDSVRTENRAAAAALTRHLLVQGARRLVYLGDPEATPDVAERWEAVQQTAEAAGAEAELRPTHELDEHAGLDVARRELATDSLPDAFLCANDEIALGLLTALASRGVRAPDQVLVTGWDDVMAARYAGLTTVRQPMRHLGELAARLLDERITGRRTEPRHELLPTELVVRASTGVSRREIG